MTHRVVIQPRAERDIRDAALWVLDRSKSRPTALRWAKSIREKIATLATQPLRAPIDPDSAAFGEEVRVLLHGRKGGRYRILFAVRGDVVHVLTVRHAARQSLVEEDGIVEEE